MKMYLFLMFLGLSLLASQGCKKDKVADQPVKSHAYDRGVFITSEGQYPNGAGAISFYDRTTGVVQKDIFRQVNGISLGNVVQSMAIFDTLAYIVVNNGGKIEVVSSGTFKSKGTITGLISPRYFMGISGDKAYVSDWANNVAIVNTATRQIVETIATGTGPEQMVMTGNDVYVVNGGGWGIDSTVTVIDTRTDRAIHTVKVGKRPTGIVADGDGNVWVMCSGKGFNDFPQAGDTKGHLVRINHSTYAVDMDITFPGTALHPERLTANKEKTLLYFLYSGGIYQMNISGHIFNYSVLVENGHFYNLGCDPAENVIYATDALDFQQAGLTYRFKASDGTPISSFGTGVGPGNFCFR